MREGPPAWSPFHLLHRQPATSRCACRVASPMHQTEGCALDIRFRSTRCTGPALIVRGKCARCASTRRRKTRERAGSEIRILSCRFMIIIRIHLQNFFFLRAVLFVSFHIDGLVVIIRHLLAQGSFHLHIDRKRYVPQANLSSMRANARRFPAPQARGNVMYRAVAAHAIPPSTSHRTRDTATSLLRFFSANEVVDNPIEPPVGPRRAPLWKRRPGY